MSLTRHLVHASIAAVLAPAAIASAAPAEPVAPAAPTTPATPTATPTAAADAAATAPVAPGAAEGSADGDGAAAPANAVPAVPANTGDGNGSAPTPEATVATAAPPQRLHIGAGAILWYYQPLRADTDNDFSIYFANLVLDGDLGKIGLHVEPRIRATKLRPFFDGPAWIEEAYVHGKLGPATVKVGKVYSRLGLFWDNCFYGNVQVFDGLKLAPDYGVSVEGAVREDARAGLRYWGQYFVVDGATNVSLPGRDTVSIPGARRRNEVVARAEPFVKVGAAAEVRFGVSGQFLQADLPSGEHDVYRGAVDARAIGAHFGAWAEVLYQHGQHVDGFPIAATPATADAPAMAGSASARNTYALVGGEYTVGPVVGRYNVSYGRYGDVDTHEWLHEPALGYTVNDNVALLAELVLWNRSAPGVDTTLDRSLNVTLHGHF